MSINVRIAFSTMIGSSAVIAASAMIGAALLAAAPAGAVTPVTAKNGELLSYTFDLSSGSAIGGTGSSYGNTLKFDEQVKGLTINATASAWTGTQVGTSTTYTIASSHLGQYAEGLGVTNRLEGDGGGAQHQIDNFSNGTDFVLLEFDQPVVLSGISRYSFAMSGNSQAMDNDASVSSVMPTTTTTSTTITTTTVTKSLLGYSGTPSVTTKTSTPVISTATTASSTAAVQAAAAAANTTVIGTTVTRSDTTVSTGTFTSTRTKVTERTDVTTNASTTNSGNFTSVPSPRSGSLNGSVVLAATQVQASKTWLVGASFTNSDGPDGFKLKNVTVSWKAVVPEPSTWAMMIVGFGFVGAAARRQRRIAAAA